MFYSIKNTFSITIFIALFIVGQSYIVDLSFADDWSIFDDDSSKASAQPSQRPMEAPEQKGSRLKVTETPTSYPSSPPSELPSLSSSPSSQPSSEPSLLPSVKPSLSLSPTLSPSLSMLPSLSPTMKPSSKPSEKKCEVSSLGNFGTITKSKKIIKYEYQLHYKGNLNKILKQLEAAISNFVLETSSFFEDCSSSNKNRALSQQSLVGLSSRPKDKEANSTCTANDNSTCVVMDGRMSLYYDDVDSRRRLETDEENVQRIIEEGMKNGNFTDSNPNIITCEFIPQQENRVYDNEGVNEEDNTINEGVINEDKDDPTVDNGDLKSPKMSSTALTMIFIASAGTVLLVLLAAIKVRLTRLKHEKEAIDHIEHDSLDDSSISTGTMPAYKSDLSAYISRNTENKPNDQQVFSSISRSQSSIYMNNSFSNNPQTYDTPIYYDEPPSNRTQYSMNPTSGPNHVSLKRDVEDHYIVRDTNNPTLDESDNYLQLNTTNSKPRTNSQHENLNVIYEGNAPQFSVSSSNRGARLGREEDVFNDITPRSNVRTLGPMVSPVVSSKKISATRFNFDNIDNSEGQIHQHQIYGSPRQPQESPHQIQSCKTDVLFDVDLDDASASTYASPVGTRYADNFSDNERSPRIKYCPSDENKLV